LLKDLAVTPLLTGPPGTITVEEVQRCNPDAKDAGCGTMLSGGRIHYSPGFGDGTPGGVRAGKPTKKNWPRKGTPRHPNPQCSRCSRIISAETMSVSSKRRWVAGSPSGGLARAKGEMVQEGGLL